MFPGLNPEKYTTNGNQISKIQNTKKTIIYTNIFNKIIYTYSGYYNDDLVFLLNFRSNMYISIAAKCILHHNNLSHTRAQ